MKIVCLVKGTLVCPWKLDSNESKYYIFCFYFPLLHVNLERVPIIFTLHTFFRKQLGDQQNENCKLLFLSSSICVGYLTHRLVHFRIRVNGPEDNGVYQKHKALVTLEPWLSGSTYSIIVTTSCICSWVRAVVNWFTTLFFARKSIISSSKWRQKSNRVLRFFFFG